MTLKTLPLVAFGGVAAILAFTSHSEIPLTPEGSVAHAAFDKAPESHNGFVRCGVVDLTVAEAEAVERDIDDRLRAAGISQEEAEDSRIHVPVVVHVINEGESEAQGNVTDAKIAEQMAVLSDAYAACGVTFSLDRVTRTTDARWYTMTPGSAEEAEAKETLHVDTSQYMNVYLAGIGQGLLGWATFPTNQAEQPGMDGVVVLNTSLPGGSAAPYDEGDTLTHEAGHWLGLYHTFQGGCVSQGDLVFDTSPERFPAYGCPESRDTCNRYGTDPVDNFMNYVDDACMNTFTFGQCLRISQITAAYRPALLVE